DYYCDSWDNSGTQF
nr:immunoglobulin light chain junction region [Macaca mulatta]